MSTEPSFIMPREPGTFSFTELIFSFNYFKKQNKILRINTVHFMMNQSSKTVDGWVPQIDMSFEFTPNIHP